MTRITLREDQYTFFITSCSVLLGMINASEKSRRENQTTLFMFNNFFFCFFFENRAFYEIMWKNI